jgi:hypothetical protein
VASNLRKINNGSFAGGGGGDYIKLMERVSALEQVAKNAEQAINEIKSDVRELRKTQTTDFRIVFGAIIVTALGLAGLMAKGFHWM